MLVSLARYQSTKSMHQSIGDPPAMGVGLPGIGMSWHEADMIEAVVQLAID
jgi:hypothetical protein